MRLNECIEMNEIKGRKQLIEPEKRVQVIKNLAGTFKDASPTASLIKALSEKGFELLKGKISENTVNYDLQKYVILEKALRLDGGELNERPNVDDILTLVCLQSRDEIKKLANEIEHQFDVGLDKEKVLDWLKKKAQGELPAAKKRYYE